MLLVGRQDRSRVSEGAVLRPHFLVRLRDRSIFAGRNAGANSASTIAARRKSGIVGAIDFEG